MMIYICMEKDILEKFKRHDIVVGIDEVGRGPLAGPVTVCAFGIDKKHYNEVLERLAGITDSKHLSEKKRNFYSDIIKELKKEGKINVSVSSVSAPVIDKKGIRAALRAALKRSIKNITKNYKNPFIYLDGLLYVDEKFSQETITKGDSKNWLIGSASVIAKVTRDTQMKKYAEQYPEYGFEKHKGYGTKKHYENIFQYGVCEIHRKTWIRH